MHSLISICVCSAGNQLRVHVSGLLHALVAMSPNFPSHSVMDPSTSEPEEEALPITSYVCQWKPPRKRKESTLQMSEATFHKPVCGREKRRSSKPLEEFAPRPPEYKNTAQGRLTEFLGKVHGKGLCVSLMFNSASQYWQDETQTLRGYTHWMKSEVGFQSVVNEQLIMEADVKEEKDKYEVLVFDEMKIREDLVFDKHSCELVGFVNLGEYTH